MKNKKDILFYGIILFILCCMLFGCKSQVKVIEVPVEKVKTEYLNKLQLDSIHIIDSIFVKDKGDTVFYNKYKYIYRYKNLTDTVIKVDSIQVPYRVDVPGETKTVYPPWLVILGCLGALGIGLIIYKLVH